MEIGARQTITLEFVVGHVPEKVGHDTTRMYGEGANVVGFATAIEFDGKEDVRRFRLAVRLPLVVGTVFEVEIVEIHVGALVTARGEGDDASAVGVEERGPEAHGELEMAQVIGSELGFVAAGVAYQGRPQDRKNVAEYCKIFARFCNPGGVMGTAKSGGRQTDRDVRVLDRRTAGADCLQTEGDGTS